ncbi:MAG: PilZ domain-containing protein, partial [Planctomycetales bacterium]|nr:PilZ domain-containing protein [Planctomycetales bacterium]
MTAAVASENAAPSKENVKTTRYVIEDKDVSVIVTVKPDDFRETGETFEAKLLDLSQNGARLVVPNEVPNT